MSRRNSTWGHARQTHFILAKKSSFTMCFVDGLRLASTKTMSDSSANLDTSGSFRTSIDSAGKCPFLRDSKSGALISKAFGREVV